MQPSLLIQSAAGRKVMDDGSVLRAVTRVRTVGGLRRAARVRLAEGGGIDGGGSIGRVPSG